MKKTALLLWLQSLPTDVYAGMMCTLFSKVDGAENELLKWVRGEEEVPLVVKCCIERASEAEGYPFSFNDMRVVVLSKVIDMAITIVEQDFPGISGDDIFEKITPMVEFAAMCLMDQPDHLTLTINN